MENSQSPSIVGARVYRDEDGVMVHFTVERAGYREIAVVAVGSNMAGTITMQHVQSALGAPSQKRQGGKT